MVAVAHYNGISYFHLLQTKPKERFVEKSIHPYFEIADLHFHCQVENLVFPLLRVAPEDSFVAGRHFRYELQQMCCKMVGVCLYIWENLRLLTWRRWRNDEPRFLE